MYEFISFSDRRKTFETVAIVLVAPSRGRGPLRTDLSGRQFMAVKGRTVISRGREGGSGRYTPSPHTLPTSTASRRGVYADAVRDRRWIGDDDVLWTVTT